MAKHRYKWAQLFINRLGNKSSRRVSSYLDDLFSIPGNPGLIRALTMSSKIKDQDLKDRINESILIWNGCPSNELEARRIVTGYAYLSAILKYDRAILLPKAELKDLAKSFIKMLSQKWEQIQVLLKSNAKKHLGSQMPIAQPKQIQVLLISNAPALAPNLLIRKSKRFADPGVAY